MTFDIGLHEVCVRVGVRYVITKFSQMDSLPNFVTHGAPLGALRARESSAICVRIYRCTIKLLKRFNKFANRLSSSPKAPGGASCFKLDKTLLLIYLILLIEW